MVNGRIIERHQRTLPLSTFLNYVSFSAIICFLFIFLLACDSQTSRLIIPDERTDQILFKDINEATGLANLPKLRESRVASGDLEIRIWRGFGLSKLEAVVIKRTNGSWSGLHLRGSHHSEPQSVKVDILNPPKSGWESFWKSLLDKGILTIRETSENECNVPGLDGIGYVVEISQDKIYRYYYYPENGKCSEARQTKEIGETIGLEFDSGTEECNTIEWFACMTFRKTHDLRP